VDFLDEDVALLPLPRPVTVTGLSLTAAPGRAEVGRGESAPAWLFNGLNPGPALTARRGEHARITLRNELPEETIVHWHGLLVPEEADGHPMYAIPPGANYDYAFPIQQRAGTYWYHPHAHHRTAGQMHRGLAGFFIVGDPEEDALRLPGGPREVLLMLQDRQADSGKAFTYEPSHGDHVTGVLGDTPYGNGTERPRLQVSADTYRFRILNASNARVYRLGLSSGERLTVLGNDGGLLPTAAEVDSVYLGVGERIDILVDFGGVEVGQRLMLQSLPFPAFASADERFPQGMELDLLEVEVVSGRRHEAVSLPQQLSTVPLFPAADVRRERLFDFSSIGGQAHHFHRINDRSFDMLRVDERVPLHQLERWVFRNSSGLPHPVHLHGTHFQVISRVGGRGTLFPYEGGLKDTVLLMPLEEVEVLVRFDAYRGIFPLHCHNLQHEDDGMMLNIEVV